VRNNVVQRPSTSRRCRRASWRCASPFTDTESYFISEVSVYRLLKARDLIASPAVIVDQSSRCVQEQDHRPNQLWQTDFTDRPRRLSEVPVTSLATRQMAQRPPYQTRSAPPDHRSSDAQGKIKHWHQTLKNRILLENYFLPGDLEKPVEFVQLGVVTDATGESPRVPMAAGAVCPRSAGLGLAERVGG
jgi:hypothetical protein